MRCLTSVVLASIFTPCFCDNGMFGWMFSNYENKDTIQKQQLLKGVDTSVAFSVKIPFEISSTDEQFINAMENLMPAGMSPLDKCNNKVIIGLQGTCTDISDEELSKTAVNLLNCQSAIENRPVYSCTKRMRIHECTADMDRHTWNAYHIVSNRARAVCYQLRQEQFKAQTEMIVNQLISSAEEQAKAMGQLHEQQGRISKGQGAIHGFVRSNIRELAKEKSIIASGQKELTRTTLSIKEKLESARNILVAQGNDQQEIHKQILIDLTQIQENARELWRQLDDSTSRMLKIHNQTALQYGLLLNDLNRMNYTVHQLLYVITTMKTSFEDKFAWISSLLGETDVGVNKINSVVIHVMYLVVAMLASNFLQAPYITRVLIVSLVPLNALAEYHQNQSLPFGTLTALLAVCLLCNLTWNIARTCSWITQRACDTFRHYEGPTTNRLQDPNLESLLSPVQDCFSDDESNTSLQTAIHRNKELMNSPKGVKDYSNDELRSSSTRPLFLLKDTSKCTLAESDHGEGYVSPSTTTPIGVQTQDRISRSQYLFQRTRQDDSTERITNHSHRFYRRKVCSAISKKGVPCRIQAPVGYSFCHIHGSRDTTPMSE